MRPVARAGVWACLIVTASVVVVAREEPEGEGREGLHMKHGGKHRNELAVVVGGTYEAEETETLFTFGVEYERMFERRFGVSAVAEYLPDNDAFVVIAPMTYRPVGPLRLVTGPGVEIEPRRKKVGPSAGGVPQHVDTSDDEKHFLWRFGVGYSFEIGEGVAITPAFDVDLIRRDGEWDRALVFDVAVGFAF